MTPSHYEHLDDILAELEERVTEKQENGQVEHGGKLWKKPGLLDEALNEVIDLAVYLITLKQQIEKQDY